MKKSSILIIISIAVIFLFLKVVIAKAESCGGVPLGAPAGGTYTIDANTAPSGGCTFAYTVDGIEQGNIKIDANYTLTINQNQTVVWNPGYSVIIDGSIAINKGTPGGQLKKTYIWAKDIDNDGYLDQTQPFVAQDSNPGGGSKRRYQLTSWPSSFDCNDGNVNIFQNIANLVTDADHDGYSVGTATTTCVGSTQSIGGRTYYKDSNGNHTWLPSASSSGSDSNDSNDCIDTVTHECCDATNPTDGNRPPKSVQCLSACKRCNGTSTDVEYTSTAGNVCSGGSWTTPSASAYCSIANACSSGSCSGTRYYNGCAAGSTNCTDTGRTSVTIYADVGYTFDSDCNNSTYYYCNQTNATCVNTCKRQFTGWRCDSAHQCNYNAGTQTEVCSGLSCSAGSCDFVQCGLNKCCCSDEVCNCLCFW